MRVRPFLLLPAVVAVACSSGAAHPDFVGVVTTVSPRLCVGRPAASGDCFLGSGDQLRGVRIGECVSVDYKALPGDGPRGRVVAVRAAVHAPDWCHP